MHYLLRRRALACVLALAMLPCIPAAAAPRISTGAYSVPSRVGGPDAFGYRFKDSSEPDGPAYSWIEIVGAGGVNLGLADDSIATINSTFPITYYGISSSTLRASMNGALLFNTTNGNISFTNGSVSTAPSLSILPFWDDLYPGLNNGNVYWAVVGTAPQRRLVVEWYNVPHRSTRTNASSMISFEVVFFEESSTVLFQYQDVLLENVIYDSGGSATVGIRGPSSAAALEYSFNQASLSDGLAISFIPTKASFTSTAPDTLGQTTVFTNTSLGTISAYAWDFGDGATSTAQHPVHTYAASGTYTATLTVTDTSDVADSYSAQVQILPQPVAGFTSTTPDTLGTATSFTDTSTGVDLSYLWDFGDGATSTMQEPTHTYTASGTYSVTLTVTDPAMAESAVSHAVVILQRPAVILPPTLSVQEGQLAIITATLSLTSTDVITAAYRSEAAILPDATAGQDYTPVSGTLTFMPGATAQAIMLPTLADEYYEPSEYLSMTLVACSDNVDLGAPHSTLVTIENTNPVPSVSFSDAEVREGDTAQVSMTLSIASSDYITITYVTNNNTAIAGSDYTAISGTIFFNPGETVHIVDVPTLADTLYEGDESFFAQIISGQNASPGNLRSTVTIHDALPLPTLSISDATVSEGTTAVVTVTLSGSTALTTTVDFSTAAGSALANADYTPLSGTLVFVPGEQTQTIQIATADDGEWEGNESFSVVLSNPSNAALANATATVTIMNVSDKMYIPLILR